jgi:hypothetical protein
MQAPGSWAPSWTGPIDWRTSCPSKHWWTSPAVCDHRPRPRGTGRAVRRQTRGCATRADPPTVEEIILVMRQAGPGPYADRTRGLIAILWRAGLRISEALALTETDLDARTGSVLVRSGKGGKRRMVGMDDWAWEHVAAGPSTGSSCPSGRCSASLPDRHAGADGQQQLRAVSFADSLPRLRTAAVRTTPAAACSRDRDGARRDPVADYPEASSGMRTSGSRRSTSKV